MDGDTELRADVPVDEQRLGGVNVLGSHEPARLVGADGDGRNVKGAQPLADLLEHAAVAGVAWAAVWRGEVQRVQVGEEAWRMGRLLAFIERQSQCNPLQHVAGVIPRYCFLMHTLGPSHPISAAAPFVCLPATPDSVHRTGVPHLQTRT